MSYMELFNHCHLNTQNTIERSFGIWKWSALHFFNKTTHIRIINTCFVLCNFIINEDKINQLLEVQDFGLFKS